MELFVAKYPYPTHYGAVIDDKMFTKSFRVRPKIDFLRKIIDFVRVLREAGIHPVEEHDGINEKS
jgi:hypothetical protein